MSDDDGGVLSGPLDEGEWTWHGPREGGAARGSPLADHAGWTRRADAGPYHLVVVTTTGPASCEAHSSAEALCAGIVAACRSPSVMQAFAFGPAGERIGFWHGPAPGAVGAPYWGSVCLVDPGGWTASGGRWRDVVAPPDPVIVSG